jgi:hypothetical protein
MLFKKISAVYFENHKYIVDLHVEHHLAFEELMRNLFEITLFRPASASRHRIARALH